MGGNAAESKLVDTAPKKADFDEIMDCGGFIRKFGKEPKPNPKMVCVDFASLNITHKELLREVQRVIPLEKIRGIRFENVEAIIGGEGERKNRWIIECVDNPSRNKLVNREFIIQGQTGKVRLYGLAVIEEYKQFLRHTKQSDKLQSLL